MASEAVIVVVVAKLRSFSLMTHLLLPAFITRPLHSRLPPPLLMTLRIISILHTARRTIEASDAVIPLAPAGGAAERAIPKARVGVVAIRDATPTVAPGVLPQCG